MPADYAARPKKSLGQHFLIDEGVIDQLVALINPQPDDQLLEIGPGPGALTERLAGHVRRFDLVEIDRELAAALAARFASDQTVHLHHLDALDLDVARLRETAPIRICGNLPYNISTPLLIRLMAQTRDIADMTFMVQKEVAERVTAAPGSGAYGRLSVAVQYGCAASLAFDVAPDAFRPPPRVWSSVMTLTPRPPAAAATDLALLANVVRLAFSQRRKTLRNALKNAATPADFSAIDIDASRRPETLSVAEFVALANRLSERGARIS